MFAKFRAWHNGLSSKGKMIFWGVVVVVAIIGSIGDSVEKNAEFEEVAKTIESMKASGATLEQIYPTVKSQMRLIKEQDGALYGELEAARLRIERIEKERVAAEKTAVEDKREDLSNAYGEWMARYAIGQQKCTQRGLKFMSKEYTACAEAYAGPRPHDK